MGRSKKNWDHLVNLDGTYGIDIKNGIWPGSGLARKGEPGEPGDPGEKGHRGFRGPKGSKGEEGTAGGVGGIGPQGDSAYEVALDEGFVGTEAEWLESLKGELGPIGPAGDNAYEVAKDNGFTGTEAEWLESLKGEKGDDGAQGPKGEASGIFKFQGSQPTFPDIENIHPDGLEPGDVYQDESTDDLYVWDGNGWVLLTEALEVVKGQKGDEGPSAYDVAVKGGFSGNEAAWLESLKGEEGAGGADGDSAYDVAVNNGFQGNEVEWLETLKGDEGDQGERGDSAYETAVKGGFGGTPDEWIESLKGDQGDVGPEGPGAYEYYFNNTSEQPPKTEAEWLDSLKGDKGEPADILILDDYYTSDEVDDLLALIPSPGAGNNINEMPDENVFEPPGTLNLLAPDQTQPEYNPGIITAEVGVTIVGGPDGVVAPITITNTVIKDETGLRGPDYTVFQELVEVKSGGSSYTRTAVPGQNQFGDWTEASFDSDSYYTKLETEALVEGVEGTLSHEAGAVKLTQTNSGETSVQLEGTGGISISSGANGIVIDGSALTPTPQFLGILQDGDDPNVKQTTPTDGEYFLYGYTGVTIGTDPGVQDCTPGDWCIYNTDKWVHLDVSSDSGVIDVDVNGGLLTIDKTDPEQPDIGLDLADIINDTNLDDYAKKEYVDALELNDLSNVDAPGASEGNTLVYDSVKGDWVPGGSLGDYLPLAGGTMKGDIDFGGNAIAQEGTKYIEMKSGGSFLRGPGGISLSWNQTGGGLSSNGVQTASWNNAGITVNNNKYLKLKTEGTADDHVVTKAYVDQKATEVSLKRPFLGAYKNQFDAFTGTFPDADIVSGSYATNSGDGYISSGTQLVASTRARHQDYVNPMLDVEWDRVKAGDKLVIANYSYSRHVILEVDSIVMNTAGTAVNIEYTTGSVVGTDSIPGVALNFFVFAAETSEGEILEIIDKLIKGVLYATGDQTYTGSLHFNEAGFRVTEVPLNDGSGKSTTEVTAGLMVEPYIAVKDNEILTLGGFKAHEEARGGFLELSGGTLTGDTKFESSNLIFAPITTTDNQGADAAGRWNYIRSERLRDPDGGILNSNPVHNFGIRVDLTAGRTGYNKFEFFSNTANDPDTGASQPDAPFIQLNGGNSPGFKVLRGLFSLENNRIRKLGDPVDDTDAVNKQYADGRVSKAGDTMTGKLTVPNIEVVKGGNIQVSDTNTIKSDDGTVISFGGGGAFYKGSISVDDHMINKKYVDDAVLSAGVEVTNTTPTNRPVGKMWFDTSKNALYIRTN